MTSTIFDIALLSCFPRMQFHESNRVLLPKRTISRLKKIEFLKRAQTHSSNKRITSEWPRNSSKIDAKRGDHFLQACRY
jgi:hypothetical protein